MGRIRGFFHPRAAAEARYYAVQDRQVAEYVEEREADLAYWRWSQDEHPGENPPKSKGLDETIERYAEQYPEVSRPERVQQQIEQEISERGPSMSYPEYEGPGFTEPPADWEGCHEDHEGWTFSEWADVRGYDPERVDEINHEFPRDRKEEAYTAWRDQPWLQQEQFLREKYRGDEETADCDSGQSTDVTFTLAADGVWEYDSPGSEGLGGIQMREGPPGVFEVLGREREQDAEPKPGELRFVPMKDYGAREIRGEPDPYIPLYLPSYSYWAEGKEAAE